jgi:hypothetical protein
MDRAQKEKAVRDGGFGADDTGKSSLPQTGRGTAGHRKKASVQKRGKA